MPGLSTACPAVTIVAATLSLVLQVTYWNTQPVFGIAIDLALVVAAVLRPDWVERLIG